MRNNTDLFEYYYKDAQAIVNPALSEIDKEHWCHDYVWNLIMKDERYKPTVQVSQHE